MFWSVSLGLSSDVVIINVTTKSFFIQPTYLTPTYLILLNRGQIFQRLNKLYEWCPSSKAVM
ncbi:hypothetical protein BpHYR1_038918 [Brachionus plicatilis]|uniref:Uncharacterized protein n=1 Tax=Brachionus plicatilis TaxID=10195 RepID=A0A3M7S0J2_BRAPC|nr:hypothetical protein BpHYR1_038918 [Brachionus plicatilis]